MDRRFLRSCVALTALLVASACGAPRIRIERSRPASFQLSHQRPILVRAVPDGSEPAAETVMMAALSVTQGQLLNKFVAVLPVQKAFMEQLHGARYTLGAPGNADLVLKLVPVSWTYEIETLEDVRVGNGKLKVQIEISNARDPDAAPLYSETFWGKGTSKSIGEPEAMSDAAQNIAESFLEDLQPGRVSHVVELDDDDPVVKPGLQLCRKGELGAAYVAFSDIAARHPGSAPALYNLAVLAEARGSYDEAATALTRAIRIHSKPMYHQAVQRVRVARRDWDLLQQQGD